MNLNILISRQIVNWADPSWWQARKVNSNERPGLIPSQDLEERRQCFVRNGFNKQVTCCGQKVSNPIPLQNHFPNGQEI